MLTKGDSEIIAFLKNYELQQKNLKMELFKVCWFMRGGVTYHEALEMGPADREIVADLVKDNMETTKKTGRDFF